MLLPPGLFTGTLGPVIDCYLPPDSKMHTILQIFYLFGTVLGHLNSIFSVFARVEVVAVVPGSRCGGYGLGRGRRGSSRGKRKTGSRFRDPVAVPEGGVEPPPTKVDTDLNRARLPIPPPGLGGAVEESMP